MSASNTPTPKTEFHITDEASANWLLRKLANLEAERARVKAQAARIVAQLDADEKHLRDLYEAEAREWARQELGKRAGRRRSLPLLQGTLAFRTVPPSLRVEDVAAALSTAAELGAVRVDVAAYRDAAITALQERGEILPGCVRDGEREHFAIRFGKDSGTDSESTNAESTDAER